MVLIELIKSIVGVGAAERVEKSNGFLLTPDSQGVSFTNEPRIFSQIEAGGGPLYPRIQLVALKMLEEQGLAQRFPNTFYLFSEVVAGLEWADNGLSGEDGTASILGLPPHLSANFTLNVEGRTTHPRFRCQLRPWMDGKPVSYRIKGPMIYFSDTERYRLTPAQLYAFEALHKHEALGVEQRTETNNLELVAGLQAAKRSGMDVDLAHFDSIRVHEPESIGVTARENSDGSWTLFPSFGDGSSQEELERRWSQLELNSDQTGVLRVGNRVVVLEPERMKAVKEVLNNRKIPKDQVQNFIQSPTAFLDATLVDLEVGFSVRVEGIGRFVHMNFAGGGDVKPDWFQLGAPARGAGVIRDLVQTREDGIELKRLVRNAAAQGALSVYFQGAYLDISDPRAIEVAIDERLKELDKPEVGGDPKEPREPKEKLAILVKQVEQTNAELKTKLSETKYDVHPVDWSNIKRSPFPHQKEGVNWICRFLGCATSARRDDLYRIQGALLADDMGLGKTYMTLVAANEYYRMQREHEYKERPTLVVAPLSLLENWRDEVGLTFHSSPFKDIVVLQSAADLNRFRVKGVQRESSQVADLEDDEVLDESAIQYALHIGPEAGVKRLDQNRRLILTTYQTLRDYQFSLCSIDWGMVIFDEAQNIKNPNALQTRAAKALNADFKLLATGTPVENSLGDFWCLMDTAQPGLVGDWDYFRHRWVKPIQNAPDAERQTIQEQCGRDLRESVEEFMLRRVKEDQLEGLPSRTFLCGVPRETYPPYKADSELSAVMRDVQLQQYDDVVENHRRAMQQGAAKGQALTTLAAMRRISLHHRLDEELALYPDSAKDARKLMNESGKLAVLLERLDRIKTSDEKVILFMVTKRLQRMLKFWLDKIYGLNVDIINGDTAAVPKKIDVLSRKQLIARFEEKKGFNVLIMSPVAAGVGLTVVGANHVIHLERHWNPAKEAQASDRVYRIGQKKDVYVHLPALLHPSMDSFDVHLDSLLRGKLDLKDAVVTPDVVDERSMVGALGLT